jgi:hypothetical protein
MGKMNRKRPRKRAVEGAREPARTFGYAGKAATLACGLALACSWSSPGRALTPAPTGPSVGVELEVEIDPRIDGADDLVTWVDEEGRKALAELTPNPDRQGLVRVGIGGQLYDYDVTLTPMRSGQAVGTPSAWECECSNEELLDRLRRELPGAAERLVVKKKRVTTPRVRPKPMTPEDERRRPQRHARLGPVGGAGTAVALMGLAAAGAGIALIARVNKDQLRGDDIGGLTERTEYDVVGSPLIAGGIGIAFSGLVMVLVDSRRVARRNERAQVSPVTGLKKGMMFSGRF